MNAAVTALIEGITSGDVVPSNARNAIRDAGGDSFVLLEVVRQLAAGGSPTGAYVNKGNIDASTNPNYPVGVNGDTYIITVAGKVGGASGKTVEVGDMVIAKADNAGGTEASVGASWIVVQGNVAFSTVGLAVATAASEAAGRTALGFGQINAQVGTSYTLVLADNQKLVTMENGSANTVTVPPNEDVAFPVGAEIALASLGAGATSVVAGSGVTVQSAGSLLGLDGQFATAALIKLATNTWLLAGKLA